MPKEWHDRHAANKIEDDERRGFYRRIVAERKPYFMRYIYPDLMREYNAFLKNTKRNALREFQMTVDELRLLPEEALTERQRDFLRYCEYRNPVGSGDCVMNRICRRFEEAFDGFVKKYSTAERFDYTIMRSGAEYTPSQICAIRRLYEDYNNRLSNYAIFASCERVDEFESISNLTIMNEEFSKACSIVCPNSEALCNIILDICYRRSSTKMFAWNMCGDVILRNLLEKNRHRITYPVLRDDGDITYCGNRFAMETTEIEVEE